MTRNRLVGTWLVSIVILAVTAGQSWGIFEVSLEAGGASLEISGFEAFPVIGTLIGLQLIAILLSFITSPVVTRVVGAVVAGLVLFNVGDVLLNAWSMVNLSAQRDLADRTGIVQDIASSDFVIASSVSWWSSAYLIAGLLNIVVLVGITIGWKDLPSRAKSKPDRDLPEDLWGDQK